MKPIAADRRVLIRSVSPSFDSVSVPSLCAMSEPPTTSLSVNNIPPSPQVTPVSPPASSAAVQSISLAREGQDTPAPVSATRTRSFSLLQNIALPNPFAPRPTPLRATTTQLDGQGEMSRSMKRKQADLPHEIVLQIESYAPF